MDQYQQAIAKQKHDAELRELSKKEMIYLDEDAKEWYPQAIECLQNVSCEMLAINSKERRSLREISENKISLNNMAYLIRTVVISTPFELGYTEDDYCTLLELNERVEQRWKRHIEPISESIRRKLKIMNNKPIMSIKHGEA